MKRKRMANLDNNKKLVLVGGGHTHLHLKKNLISLIDDNIEVTLISASEYQYYSGMTSGFLEGIYDEKSMRINLADLCKKYNIKFIKAKVMAVDAANKKLNLDTNESVDFDVLTLDTGSQVIFDNYPKDSSKVYPVKPISNLVPIKDLLKTLKSNPKIFIAGAGAAGVEVVLAIRAFANDLGINMDISLLNGSTQLLKEYPQKFQGKILEKLKINNINILTNYRVKEITKSTIILDDERSLEYDCAIIATGSRSSFYMSKSDFQLDNKDNMLVNEHLQSTSHPFIFGGGDCISFENYDYVKKVGVYAVKEGPYLYNNILNFIHQKPLEKYIPQRKYLSIISTSRKTAVLNYGNIVFSGKIAWHIKNYIDKNFISRYV